MNEALMGLTSEPFEIRHESTNAKFEILMAYLVEACGGGSCDSCEFNSGQCLAKVTDRLITKLITTVCNSEKTFRY